MLSNNITKTLSASLLLAGLSLNTAQADLFVEDYGININGDAVLSSDGIPFQPEVDSSGYSTITGLGSILVELTGAGAYQVDAFFDYDFSEGSNSLFNENGSASGGLASGQSWEIDEPGFVFGDIFDNWLVNALDDSNSVPSGSEDDVSVGLGWDFNLLTDEVGEVVFDISALMPASGFFLSHTDPDSSEQVYFSSSLTITTPIPSVPEPEIVWLLMLGVLRRGLKSFVRTTKGWRVQLGDCPRTSKPEGYL